MAGKIKRFLIVHFVNQPIAQSAGGSPGKNPREPGVFICGSTTICRSKRAGANTTGRSDDAPTVTRL
jgi:hypothetical protein